MPIDNLDDFITQDELCELSNQYKQVAGSALLTYSKQNGAARQTIRLRYNRPKMINHLGGSMRNMALARTLSLALLLVTNFQATQWVGLLAPAQTMRGNIDRLNAVFNRVLQEVVAKLEKQGMSLVGGMSGNSAR